MRLDDVLASAYVRSTTGLYLPVSTSSFTRSASAFVWRGRMKTTFRSPIRDVHRP